MISTTRRSQLSYTISREVVASDNRSKQSAVARGERPSSFPDRPMDRPCRRLVCSICRNRSPQEPTPQRAGETARDAGRSAAGRAAFSRARACRDAGSGASPAGILERCRIPSRIGERPKPAQRRQPDAGGARGRVRRHRHIAALRGQAVAARLRRGQRARDLRRAVADFLVADPGRDGQIRRRHHARRQSRRGWPVVADRAGAAHDASRPAALSVDHGGGAGRRRRCSMATA